MKMIREKIENTLHKDDITWKKRNYSGACYDANHERCLFPECRCTCHIGEIWVDRSSWEKNTEIR